MSDLTQLLHGQLSPADFVPKAAADLKKDFALFQGLPFAKTLEGWAIDAIAGALASKFSPTLVSLIKAQLEAALGIITPSAP